MFISGNMNKLEAKEEDGRILMINGHVRLYIGIAEHSSNINYIYFFFFFLNRIL